MSKYNTRWTRQETLAAFNLYCGMPFGQVHHRNPTIIALAEKMGRTPSALSMKMSNLARPDPNNPSSLPHISKLDREIWREFAKNPEALTYESEQAVSEFNKQSAEERAEVPPDIVNMPDGEERERLVRVRVNQAFFRRAVLSAYDGKCCITGLGVPALLNASHIVPWSENRGRLDPSNGLCLNALHDRAFDRGLITVQTDGKILVSGELREKAADCRESAFVIGCEGNPIDAPDKFKPAADFLEFHNRHIFVGA